MEKSTAPEIESPGSLTIIAHRGASVAETENTIAAFNTALAKGANAIELDVRWTSDGTAVIFHDPSVIRNGHRIAVKKLTVDGLISLKAIEDVLVPTLPEVLAWAKDKAPLVFDIKDTQKEEELIGEMEKHGFHPQCVFSSFRLTVIGKIKALRPDWNTAWIIGNSGSVIRRLLVKPIITRAIRWGVDALHFHHSWIEPGLIARCKEENLKVAVWTVDAPAEICRLADLGVDAIITNVPDAARQVLGQNAARAGQ